ncbi:ABC transporter substrate-binding protein [Eshraghiella crossota]|uniref:ABC transporter substrate-binding protein n=1 Tax=Eshraghiella crossota TaxID=45851 RepID=UPI003F7D3359
MKKMTKFAAVALAALMAVSVTACGKSGGTKTDKGDGTYTVGICQLVEHPALDAATKGFKEALQEKLGDKVKFEEKNAQNDTETCATIVNGFVSSDVDLILANATPALQAAVAATSSIPILGTSVTEYGVALDIKDFSGKTGINVSGTSDLAPLAEQAAMIKELFPDAKKVALLYCSAEANSLYQVKVVSEELDKLGIESKQFSFADSNDISNVTQTAADYADVLYVPTDNTVAENTSAVYNICMPAKVPVIAGEEGICKGCGVASLSISYYDLGYATGKMAYEILANGADVSKMDIQYAPKFTKKYNEAICKELGVTIPEGYEAVTTE